MSSLILKSLSLTVAVLFVLLSSGTTQLHARSTTHNFHKLTALSDKEHLEGEFSFGGSSYFSVHTATKSCLDLDPQPSHQLIERSRRFFL